MPADVVGTLISFMKQQLSINAWSQEVPRWDASGNPINPQATVSPSVWPVVTCDIEKPGSDRNHTFVDAYDEVYELKIQVWGTSKVQVYTPWALIEALWNQAANWLSVVFNPTGEFGNPFYIVEMLCRNVWHGQIENERVARSQLLFRGDLMYRPFRIHGALNSA